METERRETERGDWETARGGVKNGRWKSGDHEEVGFRLERKV